MGSGRFIEKELFFYTASNHIEIASKISITRRRRLLKPELMAEALLCESQTPVPGAVLG